ncbi:MAG: hybrid sensor histidine kinase/response regulator, partial [Calditrichia bacterium]|nr:hybrid sensor histidine kinase/response regulator [Calditrichia bacterium]
HDFNNMLTPILGYSDMSMSRMEKDNPLYSYMEQISTAAYRAKDLVQQILTFSRQIEKERKPLKLHLIIKEALKLLSQSLPSTIEIKEKIDTNCSKILADPTQMHQVVLNLCVNASHAMEEKGGILTIELSQVDIDAKSVKYYTNLKEQTYIRLIVSDTRVGMDEAIIERIFESFFTTKDVNKGTGMGLSTVHGIARGHSGDISVYSEKGKGSSFHVLLPAIKDEKKSEAEEEKSLIGGNETGLIIDDEEMIANMLK